MKIAQLRKRLQPARPMTTISIRVPEDVIADLDYLLTWNCAHIANAEILPRIALLCDDLGFALPYICTPEELLGDTYAH